MANLRAAERLRHQLIEKAAYFHWINRGRPVGDPWTDWFAAEAEIASSRAAQGQLYDTIVDGLLQHQLIEQAAYFRWMNRGQPIGDPWADWLASEAGNIRGG